LTIIKHLNSKHCKQNPNLSKVLIAKTNFTQKVFSNEKINVKIDIFSSKYLLFPIFVGHWSLLSMNSTDLIVNFHDPLQTNKYLKEILKSLFKFLKVQTQLAGKEILNTNFKDLVYEKSVITEPFTEEDSAIFMLRQIYNISIGESTEVKKSDFYEYRMQFLRLLFQYGSN
jgi:hypothetical protein